MARSPNINKQRSVITTGLYLTSSEWAELKFNEPGPTSPVGGYGMFENWLLSQRRGDYIFLEDAPLGRLVRYMKNYGGGGPNARIRRAFHRAVLA